jgi:glycosyltransferase involved in cell wall biosynthesis
VREQGAWQLDSQAINGLRRWAEHFEPLTVCLPQADSRERAPAIQDWADPAALLATCGVQIVPMPFAYEARAYLHARSQARRRLRELIVEHRYLCFASIGPIGCWGNDAGVLASALERPYAVWTDSVVHALMRPSGPGLAAHLRWRVARTLAAYNERRVLGNASIGLFNGQSVHDAYARYCRRAVVVHDIHAGPEAAIADDALAAKIARVRSGAPLQVGYAGRVDDIKGPFDWIDALATAARAMPDGMLRADWYGDGPRLEAARQRVRELGVAEVITFHGFVRDREALLARVRRLDLFVHCHLTPESPRCLMEALISAAPIVGYESAYARGLVEGRGGGSFVPPRDVAGLARRVAALAADREALATLVLEAARSRGVFNDVAVFRHRAELLKAHLP